MAQIMKSLFAGCAASLLTVLMLTMVMASAQSQQPPQPSAWPMESVTLQVKPVIENGSFRAIDFSYSFVAPKEPREFILALPNEWGGERELYLAWHDLAVEGGVLSESGTVWQRRLATTPGARVTLRYRIRDEGPGSRKSRGNDYRPRIAATWFQLIGNAVVPQVSGMPLTHPARFELIAPTGMAFASDLEHGAMGRRMNVGDLIESVMVGGDFRVFDVGSGARLAIRGTWSRPDAEWRARFLSIAKSQREFWGTGNEPFLVTVLDLPDMGPGSVSTGGTGRSDAFAFFSTTNAPPERLDQTMSHEMMHTWVPRRIGRLPRAESQNKGSEALAYWLSEGFTDWASWHTNMAGGLWRVEDFASAFNESFKAYESSPVRTAPNAAIAEGFWRDPDLQKLPYQRGMLLATWWDHRVRVATKGERSFVHVLREMQRLADANPNGFGMAVEYLRTAMKTIASIDIAPDLARYVDAGEPVPLAADTFGACGTLGNIVRKVFHRGFDVEATMKANNIIAGVVVDGPAYAAGLRNGMKLVGRSGGVIGDSRVEIVYDVMDGESKKTLRWLPEGKSWESMREFALMPSFTAAARKACEARLGGANAF